MKKAIIPLCTCLFFILGCTKKEILPLEFKGDLKVKVYTSSEFGTPTNDKGNIDVALEGTDPEIKVATDTSGTVVINNLPLGTYNLVVSKEGYGTYKYQGFRFIGGSELSNISLSLTHKSTTKIKSYHLSISGTILTVSGIISHQYPPPAIYSNILPGLVMYLSNSPEVSFTNYLDYYNFNANQNNDTTFKTNMNAITSYFPSGSTIYTIIYGRNRFGSYYYDPETGLYYDPNLGDPSEIQSIVVP